MQFDTSADLREPHHSTTTFDQSNSIAVSSGVGSIGAILQPIVSPRFNPNLQVNLPLSAMELWRPRSPVVHRDGISHHQIPEIRFDSNLQSHQAHAVCADRNLTLNQLGRVDLQSKTRSNPVFTHVEDTLDKLPMVACSPKTSFIAAPVPKPIFNLCPPPQILDCLIEGAIASLPDEALTSLFPAGMSVLPPSGIQSGSMCSKRKFSGFEQTNSKRACPSPTELPDSDEDVTSTPPTPTHTTMVSTSPVIDNKCHPEDVIPFPRESAKDTPDKSLLAHVESTVLKLLDSTIGAVLAGYEKCAALRTPDKFQCLKHEIAHIPLNTTDTSFRMEMLVAELQKTKSPVAFSSRMAEAVMQCSQEIYAEAEPSDDECAEDTEPISKPQHHTTHSPKAELEAQMKQKLEDSLTLVFLDELRSHLDSLHTSLKDQSSNPNSSPEFSTSIVLYRILIMVLYVLICKREGTLDLLDRPMNRKYRNWVMAAFFRAVLRPIITKGCADTILLSKVGLARLDSKQKKIPREVVELVLRPALMQFCDINKLDMRLLIGLHSIVELFPTLFKEVFGRKILETLEVFLDESKVAASFAHVSKREICEMITHMLDFFRLFATTGAFSCASWVDKLTKLVFHLDNKWSLAGCKGSACTGFRAPLCRLLCHYPSQAVDSLMRLSTGDNAQQFSTFFASILKCKHASVLSAEFSARSRALFVGTPENSFAMFASSSLLSDVRLQVRGGEFISAHRVVLSSRSTYFQQLLRTLPPTEDIIQLDVDPEPFNVLLGHLYDTQTNLAELPWQLLVQVFALSTKFDFPRLQSQVEFHLCSKVCLENIWILIHLSCDPSSLESSPTLSLSCCGAQGGESLLRTCQSFLLANLHALSDTLDICDDITLDLLANDYDCILV